ncbi:hypothetical protein K0504_09890 [Neiella marina]|uniref:Uncharacterized protein n=1 Tax=Neiella holothuriorum TaxID=2870530 RepID=A0ABS7EHH7_9GAMM|nr:hypothetical protein [Neiella holothuriorum]MBW8191348.1 hypothetical protein [Neiella holothuriorum]
MSIVIHQANELEVKFKLGSALLADPAPMADLARKVEMLARSFPQVRFTNVFEADAVIENGVKIYNIILPPPKVNG